MERCELIKDIVEREWEMFTVVQNQGERASCQDDRETFEVMRNSQFVIWDDVSLASYREDLIMAGEQERNLPAEKYAYMMKDTAPEEYDNLRHILPPVSKEKELLASDLAEIQTVWMEQFGARYPAIAAGGRPPRKEQAGWGETALETYAKGEFLTYSEKTLGYLKTQFEELQRAGINGGEKIMEATVKAYGYQSLEEAEAQHHGR